MGSLQERMIRAAKLDVSLYEEVEADKNALGQAMGVVVLSSVAGGLGNYHMGIGGIVFMTIFSLIGWYIWAFITYFIGTKILPEKQTEADIGQLLRVLGFSSAPGVLRILGAIPLLGPIVSFAAGIWMLVAMVVAVRQALDYKSTGRAVGVCIIGWIIQIVLMVALISVFFAPMMSQMQSPQAEFQHLEQPAQSDSLEW